MNRFITFEGIDGCGKSTQIKLLSEFLYSRKITNKIIREPGGTNVSEKIRSILLDNKNNIGSYTETLLFLSSRSQLVKEVVLKAIEKKIFILCDRFTDSTLSYQGFGRGLNIKDLDILNQFATYNTNPDITFILDIEVSEAIKRFSSREKDRMEEEGVEFLRRVKNGYLDIAKRDKNRYIVLNCNGKSIKEVNQEIIDYVKNYYKDVI
tara:strand:- start:465 stop:1088 length:624 start_codon:yes stop_codon:yes gene_type:complete